MAHPILPPGFEPRAVGPAVALRAWSVASSPEPEAVEYAVVTLQAVGWASSSPHVTSDYIFISDDDNVSTAAAFEHSEDAKAGDQPEVNGTAGPGAKVVVKARPIIQCPVASNEQGRPAFLALELAEDPEIVTPTPDVERAVGSGAGWSRWLRPST